MLLMAYVDHAERVTHKRVKLFENGNALQSVLHDSVKKMYPLHTFRRLLLDSTVAYIEALSGYEISQNV